MKASRIPINVAPQSSFRHTDGKLVLIAGPCSAESEEQILKTAQQLKNIKGMSVYRAGIWKSRTRPDSFKGVDTVGLQWLAIVKKETGLRTACELANAQHAEEALKHGVDILTISGRATVNSFAMEEIAAVLKGTDTPMLVNNPVYPNLQTTQRWQKQMNEWLQQADPSAVDKGFVLSVLSALQQHNRQSGGLGSAIA